MVKFVGYTSDAPLAGRTQRIYGDHVGLSKARARRVALAVQDELNIPTDLIESDGRGATRRWDRMRRRMVVHLIGASRSSSGTTIRWQSCPMNRNCARKTPAPRS